MVKTIRMEDVPLKEHRVMTHPPSFQHAAASLPIDQGSCGACFAIASVQCIQDRVPSATPLLSYQHVADCSNNCVTYKGMLGCSSDCMGGFLASSFEFARVRGILPVTEYPIKSSSKRMHIFGGTTHRTQCDRIETRGPRYSVQGFYRVTTDPRLFGMVNAKQPIVTLTEQEHAQNCNNIKQEIYMHGPVAACLNLYSDFIDFVLNKEQGVYKVGYQLGKRHNVPPEGKTSWTKWSGPEGLHYKMGHAVSIIGWGEHTDGTPYWLVRNSWGRGKGDYVKIWRGVNCSGIESDVEAPFIDPTSMMMTTIPTVVTSARPRPPLQEWATSVGMLLVLMVLVAAAAQRYR